MHHAFLLAGLLLPFALLLGQTHPAAPPISPDPALLEVQSLVDAGKLKDAEAAARRYLEAHQNSGKPTTCWDTFSFAKEIQSHRWLHIRRARVIGRLVH